MKLQQGESESSDRRWVMLRDLGVLQVKLIVDGLRDLVLVPASLIAGIASLLSSRNGRPGPQLYRLLAWGKASEVWINLFGAVKNSPEGVEEMRTLDQAKSRIFGENDIDEIIGRLESFVVDDAKRGGLTSQAKKRIEKILDALQRRKKPSSDGQT